MIRSSVHFLNHGCRATRCGVPRRAIGLSARGAARGGGKDAFFPRSPLRHFASAGARTHATKLALGPYVWLAGIVPCFAGAMWVSKFRGSKVMAEEEEEEEELQRIEEPSGHFVHPFTTWPWHRKLWFVLKRSVFLAWVFAPFFATSVIVLCFPDSRGWRESWLERMVQCMQQSGAAFQKFGQWLSMRPDMFPPDVIQALSKLRSDAPSHSGEMSRQVLKAQFGCEIEELFEEFDNRPVASGSVGQVHRARLLAERALDGPGGRYRDVAVKVRHPGVADSAFMDLDILWKVVDCTQSFIHMTMPFDRADFDEVIKAQMDFTREAFNLQRFSRNFKREPRIRFPKVSARYVTKEVLIETWADGKEISVILEDFDNFTPTHCEDNVTSASTVKKDVQTKLSRILYDMYMNMMVRDNFVHGDLHGGNILFSENDNFVTVIDAGIATSLDKKTIIPFGKFLHALCSGHTDKLVEHLQYFDESQSKAKMDLSRFRDEIQGTMDKYFGPSRVDAHKPVNAADMFGEVMFTMQRHGMLLKSDVASTLFTISICEGLIRQLDPTLDVATNAIPYIVKHMGFSALM